MAKSKKPRIMTQDQVKQFIKDNEIQSVEDIQNVLKDMFAEIAAKYNRKVFDAGYNPICPILMLSTFINDGIPLEHRERQDIVLDYLRRSNVLVVCGSRIDEAVKNDIAIAERYRIPATTLSGILTVKNHGQKTPAR